MHPDSNPNPYGTNAPIPNPYESTYYGAPTSADPNNYGYTPYAPGGQPPPPQPPQQGAAYPVNPYQQYPGAPIPAYNQGNQPPSKRPSSGLRIAIIVILAFVIVVGAVAAIAIPIHNNQVFNANATATAQAQARAEATANANATATGVASTYPFSANLRLNDPLSDNSKGNGWDSNSNCTFAGSAYHAINTTTNTYIPCIAEQTSFSNFTYEVTMQLIKGNGAGITFRADGTRTKFYAFAVGNDGSYIAMMYPNNGKGQVLHQGNAGAIAQLHTNQANQISVVAKASTLAFYVNRQLVTTADDTTFTSGRVGMITYNLNQDTEAVFTNAQAWTL